MGVRAHQRAFPECCDLPGVLERIATVGCTHTSVYVVKLATVFRSIPAPMRLHNTNETRVLSRNLPAGWPTARPRQQSRTRQARHSPSTGRHAGEDRGNRERPDRDLGRDHEPSRGAGLGPLEADREAREAASLPSTSTRSLSWSASASSSTARRDALRTRARRRWRS